MRFSFLFMFCAVMAPGAAARQDPPDRDGVEFFEKRIRPVLADRCYSCHSARAEKLKGDLLLDTRQGLLKGGSEGPAIVPGRPDQSRLIRALRYTDEDLRMPPKGRLTAEQVADFEAWVKRGAPDPRGETVAAPRSAPHWAFQPPRDPRVPDVKRASWVKTPVDAFILAKLEEKGLRPAPPADPRTLLRRATFDLSGLPPTPQETDAFEKDASPDAFERVVERLLASPQYGERWGRHWLDVARYADTKGYAFEERRFAYSWAYRDWVIRAFNEDLPYDRFLMLQIAADRIEGDPRDLVAPAFLTIGRRFLNNFPDIVDDRLDVVFRGTQALSIGCARCHDHKYDPIPTKDYYSLYGVLAGREPEEAPLAGAPPATSSHEAYAKEKTLREEEVRTFRETRGGETVAELKTPAKIAEYLLAAHEMRDLTDLQLRPEAKRRKLNPAILPRWWFFLRKAAEERDPIFDEWRAAPDRETAESYGERLATRDDVMRRVLFDPVPAIENLFYPDGGPTKKKPMDPVDLLFDEPDAKKLRDLQNKVKELEFTHAGAPPRGMGLEEDPAAPDPRVFIRGNPASLGEQVPRRFLAALSGPQRTPFAAGSGRLELARAIASRDNPLTARVMVNRVWHHHFGAGLVRTPSDFGVRSDPPSHPELLDWLACRFVESGWSVKALHRAILLSSAWQQASEGDPEAARVDPENVLLWRAHPRRLDLEALRDSLLRVAGRLDLSMGGRGSDIVSSRRRTVYATVNRETLPSLFRTFDFALPDLHAPQRHTTTVPQQALFMMNSPFVLDQARALAARPDVAMEADAELRIARLYRLLFGRAPTPREVELGRRFVETPCEDASLAPWAKYAQVLLQSNEFMYVD